MADFKRADGVDSGSVENITEVIRLHSESTPELPAIIDGKRLITYSALYALILKYAGYLTELGLRPQDRLGLVLQDHADHLVLILAAAAMGAATVSVNWRGKVDEKHAVADAFGFKALIHDPDVRVPDVARAIRLDDSWHQGTARATPLQHVASARSFAFRILLTSGSSGTPKGIELTHAGVLGWRETIRRALGLHSRQRHLSASPLTFTGSLVFNLPHLLLGNTVELFPTIFAPEELVAVIRKRGITSTILVPTILRRLLPLAETRQPLLPELQYLISLGAPLTPEERRAAKLLLTPGFFENYGASGAGPITFLSSKDIDLHADSVGRPAPLRELEIVGEDYRPLAVGEIGRLRCRGEGVADHFCNPGDETTSELFRDGWYYPGEIGRIDEDGFVYLVGRASELIVRGGSNIFPAEIERTLMRHPAVLDAAVIGIPSKEYGEEVVAYVQVSRATPTRDLLETCRRYLVPYKVPRDIIIISELPKTANGKILKSALVSMFSQS